MTNIVLQWASVLGKATKTRFESGNPANNTSGEAKEGQRDEAKNARRSRID
jgi:hypothetical protein